MGGVTLGIYYIHIQVLRFIFLINIKEGMAVLAIIVYSLLTTYISYLLSIICLKNTITAFLVMGKDINLRKIFNKYIRIERKSD